MKLVYEFLSNDCQGDKCVQVSFLYKLAFKLAVNGHCVYLFSVFFNRERGPQIPVTVISPVYEDHIFLGDVEIVPSLSPQSKFL